MSLHRASFGECTEAVGQFHETASRFALARSPGPLHSQACERSDVIYGGVVRNKRWVRDRQVALDCALEDQGPISAMRS